MFHAICRQQKVPGESPCDLRERAEMQWPEFSLVTISSVRYNLSEGKDEKFMRHEENDKG
jgi:hypothetical protein